MRRRDPFADLRPLVDRVYAYIAYRVGDGPDAEDLTNETFERALRYRDSYDPKKGEPLSWLIGIARRAIASEGVPQAVPVEQLPDHAAPTDLEAQTIERLSVTRAVDRLEDRDRELLGLRYGADLATRQIAELLELTPNAVDVALHRALARLRAVLETTPREEAVRKAEPRRYLGVEPKLHKGES
jgi:RNA polymerase sigma-70 factor (ECF subfamily)